MDVKVDAYIPESYINDSKQKIEMYKRFKGIETPEDLQDLQDEMIDRFGDYPRETEDLFAVSRIKLLAAKEGRRRLRRKAEKSICSLQKRSAGRLMEPSYLKW